MIEIARMRDPAMRLGRFMVILKHKINIGWAGGGSESRLVLLCKPGAEMSDVWSACTGEWVMPVTGTDLGHGEGMPKW